MNQRAAEFWASKKKSSALQNDSLTIYSSLLTSGNTKHGKGYQYQYFCEQDDYMTVGALSYMK
jgi:hypothetical protein